MRSIETEGATIDEAIERALRTLRIERERVEIEILSSATRGVLGFGGKPARIRATVRPPLRVGAPDEGSSGAVSQETSAAPPVPEETDAAATCDPKAFLEALLAHMGIECTVGLAPGEEPGSRVLTVDGPGCALLIGRRGQTLDAVEYLVNRVMTRGAGAARITIDAARYRERRRESLEELAGRVAAKVRKSGIPVTLNPMSPRDRRTVHLALRDAPGVTTHSLGDGRYRKLVVAPAGGPGSGPRRPPR